MIAPQPASRPAFLRGDTSLDLLAGSIGGHLRRSAARFADRPALLWAEGETLAHLTHAQLLRESEHVAGWLLHHASRGDGIEASLFQNGAGNADGFLRTGDLASVDEHGYVRIRKTELEAGFAQDERPCAP